MYADCLTSPIGAVAARAPEPSPRPPRAETGRPWPARACLVAPVSLAAVAYRPAHGGFGRLDEAVMAAVARRRNAGHVRAARRISALAEPAVVIAPLAAAAVVAARRAGWPAACVPGLAVASGMAVRRKLSRVIARPRPPEDMWLTEPEGFSLPSKHTCLAALTAGACAAAIGSGRGASHAAALLAAAGVGASRVCLGVHWPSDVVAGWLFAAGWLELCRLLQPAAARVASSPRYPPENRSGR